MPHSYKLLTTHCAASVFEYMLPKCHLMILYLETE
jgi:hypothetical protein